MPNSCDVSNEVMLQAKDGETSVCSTDIKLSEKDVAQKASLVPKQPSIRLSCKKLTELSSVDGGVLDSSKLPDLLSPSQKVQPSTKVPGPFGELHSTTLVQSLSEVVGSTKTTPPVDGTTSAPTEEVR